MSIDLFSLDSYDYELPEDRIAQSPPQERGASRLMVVDKNCDQGEAVTDAMFDHLPEFLPQGALLVANNSRVVPARLLGVKPSGGKAELLLLTPPPLLEKVARKENVSWLNNQSGGLSNWSSAEAEVLLKPGKSIHEGDRLNFGPIAAEVLAKKEFGKHDVRLFWRASLRGSLDAVGRLPLPPYIKREQGPEDRARYQTLYARADKAGSVAAPTAGLHFTEAMRARLADEGFGWEEVTLHVGYGTFSPVRESDIRQHSMHGEYVEVSESTACAVNAAKAEGRPVIAVGTTSARTLEGTALVWEKDAVCGEKKQAAFVLPQTGWQGWTDIFMYPGYNFRVIDGLITNFHLPKSSLLMLVSALAGRDVILHAYARAVQEKYRFFSYGDAMLIRPGRRAC